MAYNYYPTAYQMPAYYPSQTQPTQPAQTQQASPSAPIWVQGEAGAKSYLVAPNQTVTLWDSEGQTIYLKSADSMGMPNIKILDYTIRDSSSQTANISAQNNYATKDDLDSLRGEIDSLKAKIKEKKGEKK